MRKSKINKAKTKQNKNPFPVRLFSSPLWLPRVVILGSIQIVALLERQGLEWRQLCWGRSFKETLNSPPTESILRAAGLG